MFCKLEQYKVNSNMSDIFAGKTLVLGASPKPHRYANKAIRKLREYGHEVVAVAKRKDTAWGVEIVTGMPDMKDIDTVTMYLGQENQKEYYSYIIALHPNRIIFNPGAENPELAAMATEAGIEVIDACTLVLLATGQY